MQMLMNSKLFQSGSKDFPVQPIQGNLLGSFKSRYVHPGTNHHCADDLTNAKASLQLGMLYWRRGDFDRSEQLLNKASEIFTDQKNVHFLSLCFIALALVNTSLEKDDGAISAYKQAIALSPENPHLWNNLARLYLKKNQGANALFAYENAIKINPGDAVAWNGLASIYDQNEKTEEAIVAYNQTIALLPKINFGETNRINQNPEVEKFYILSRIRLAALYAKKGQYGKALDTYKQGLKLDAENAELWNEIGVLLIKMNANEDARYAISKAIEFNPEYGEAYMNLAYAYARLNMPRESIPLFIKSIELLKNQQARELACNLMEQVISGLNKSTLNNTIQTGREYIPDVSDENVTWFYRYSEECTSFDFSYPTHGQANSSINVFDKPLKHHDIHPNSTANQQKTKIGVFKMIGQLSPSAVKEIQPKRNHSVTRTDDAMDEIIDSVEWNEKGNIYFCSQDYEEAIFSYTNAIRIAPSFGQPYHNLAVIHFIQGNYDEAILLFKKSIQLLNTDREKAIAWNGLGNLYRRKRDYENARLAYQQAYGVNKNIKFDTEPPVVIAIHEDQKTASYWIDLGKILFKRGAYGKAASAFQKAVQLEPTDGHAYSYLARILTAQGQYEEAISLYRKCIDLFSTNSEKASVWNRLGDVYRKLNDYDNAAKAYRNGIKMKNEKFSLLNRARLSLLSNCTAK